MTNPLDISFPAEDAEQTPSNVGDGRTVVTTAGTRQQLAAAAQACRSVLISALKTNNGVIVVGGSTVVAAVATRRGTPLEAGESMSMRIDDLTDVWLDATISGEGVAYTYVKS